jgi:hypothetical protein
MSAFSGLKLYEGKEKRTYIAVKDPYWFALNRLCYYSHSFTDLALIQSKESR